jgi:hypothetical protein
MRLAPGWSRCNRKVAIEAEGCHYGRADSDVVVAGNKREQRGWASS